jgi:DnaJ-domain-containing protein 1
LERLLASVEKLKAALEEAQRRAQRQAAPFRKGHAPKRKPKKPGRKSGKRHGAHRHRVREALRRTLRSHVTHYHSERNHQGVGNRLIEPDGEVGKTNGKWACRKRLGGMLRYYYRAAA